KERISQESIPDEKIASSMDAVNPLYIPRNHKVEEALEAAVFKNDMTKFIELHSILKKPYKESNGYESYAMPDLKSNGPYKTFCGT
ncbi:MAG: hypothetical protein VW894_05815, partial [Gammaproteobacteria bacterium]